MLLDVMTVTRELHVGESTVRRWIREGRLPVVRLGRRVLIRTDVLAKFIRASERKASPQ